MLRGTADQIALAEKLIADLDKPKAEVVVDVIVMEANRNRVRDIAATLTTGGAPGINIPIGPVNPGTGPGMATGTAMVLEPTEMELERDTGTGPVPARKLEHWRLLPLNKWAVSVSATFRDRARRPA